MYNHITRPLPIVKALNAVTATTTSEAIPLGPLGRTSLQFIASGISSGNGVFTVLVSNDGVNFIAYNRLTTNVTNTNAQTDLRAASVTLSTNTSAVVSIPDAFAYLKVVVTRTTDGTYSAVVFSA